MQLVLIGFLFFSQGTYDDYLELFMQFGYVFLFSAVFPLAAVLAIINNVFEVWTDGFKLCNAYQRPQARPVKGIGIWQVCNSNFFTTKCLFETIYAFPMACFT